MEFHSILFNKIVDFQTQKALASESYAFFVDLNLKQIIDEVVSGKEQYDLMPFYYMPLYDEEEIIYRQEIMKDLENKTLFDYVRLFSQQMEIMRYRLPKEKSALYQYEKERFFLEAIEIYCGAISSFDRCLNLAQIKSEGFLSFRKFLSDYRQSSAFLSLEQETKNLLSDLSSITYSILIKDLRVQVFNYKNETDYSIAVEHTFERFKQEAVKDYRVKFQIEPEMNHVEAAILKGVAQLYPDIFEHLVVFSQRNNNYQNKTIIAFDQEIQFYISYLEYISKVKRRGLSFCYPGVSKKTKDIFNTDGFDLALAYKLAPGYTAIVPNDFYLRDKERVIIVSGPNQGGKSTFARTFGQLHYLAALGCAVPGKGSKLFLFDRLFTHFEKEENITNLRSKLEDDLFRIHEILLQATPGSIIIMNEILSSTTLQDAILLSKRIMEKLDRLDLICVWVTFIEELLEMSDKTVSMVSTVAEDNPALRTFKIERKKADGLAYALSIAEKYQLTYSSLSKRLKS
jgi:DNA mismatch repair protein MutS